MLVVAYKQLSSQVPPAFISIDEGVLVTTAEELINRVYELFRRHLSPFITPAHLELQLPSGEVLYHHLPLFLYFNYGQHFQFITCDVRSADSIRSFHQRTDELFLSLVLRVSNRTTGQQEKILTLSKSDRNGIISLNNLIRPTDNVYITGKKILRTNQAMEWSDLLTDKWDSLQNVRDRCLYVCIDRPE